jgi:hypothetical protein
MIQTPCLCFIYSALISPFCYLYVLHDLITGIFNTSWHVVCWMHLWWISVNGSFISWKIWSRPTQPSIQGIIVCSRKVRTVWIISKLFTGCVEYHKITEFYLLETFSSGIEFKNISQQQIYWTFTFNDIWFIQNTRRSNIQDLKLSCRMNAINSSWVISCINVELNYQCFRDWLCLHHQGQCEKWPEYTNIYTSVSPMMPYS